MASCFPSMTMQGRTCPYCRRTYQRRHDAPADYSLALCIPCPVCPDLSPDEEMPSLRSQVARYVRNAPIGKYTDASTKAANARCRAWLAVEGNA